MLNYSERGLWVRRRFLAPYNDITIVVEDRNKENFYVKVLQRLLDDRITINHVNGVGGKPEVIRRFHSRDVDSPQPELFLVDGDFDELLSIDCPSSANFFRLGRYDIESYLIEEGALCLIAEEEAPGTTAEKYRELLDFEVWLVEAIDASICLAAGAAVWRELGIEQPTFSQSIERHAQGANSLPDQNSMTDHIDDLKSKQDAVLESKFDELLEDMIARMGPSANSRQRWISGKHILIPLVMKWLRTCSGSQFNKESLCFRLASKCEFPQLNDLKDRIIAITWHSPTTSSLR